MSLSTTDTLGQNKVADVERFKQESMYRLSAKKGGRFGEVAVSGASTVFMKGWFYCVLNPNLTNAFHKSLFTRNAHAKKTF